MVFMKRLLPLISLLFIPTSALADCVVFLHGYARTANSFSSMEKSFQREGFDTVSVTYPSKQLKIAELAGTVVPDAVKQCGIRNEKVHFVTHSLGGILVRSYLSDRKIDQLGRVVMLGPPNNGSEIVNKLGETKIFSSLSGPALQALKTGPDGTTSTLPPANFTVGVIAGKRSVNPVGSLLLEGPDDGAVTVESTKVKGMADHIVMPVTHTFMMRNPRVIKQTIHFVKTGAFNRS